MSFIRLCMVALAGLAVACGGGGGGVDAGAGGNPDAAACEGCVDSNGNCVTGNEDDACGYDGSPCASCAAELGAVCVGGSCEVPCGPDTCGGCCDDGVCVEGAHDGACGYGGGACSDCGADVCSNGVCVPVACSDSCSGCCSGDSCLGGTSSTACGSGGESCLDCGPHGICDGGACAIDPDSRWDVIVSHGNVNEVNVDYSNWDPVGGLPDPYVHIYAYDSPDTFEGNSDSSDNTLSPYWNDVVLENVPARALMNWSTYFQVYDADYDGDDDAGSCFADIDDSSFTNTLQKLDCPRDVSEGRAGWTIWYRIRPY